MPQVFLSYSRKDLAFVEQLAADLKSAGLDVWYDLSGLGGGDRWSREIEKGIRNSQYMVVVLSPDSIESEWVEKEFLFASSLKIKIIPLMYRDCDLQLSYANLQYIEVQGGKYKRNFNRILRALKVLLPPSQDEELKKLESQAIQFELSGEFWDALKIYYQIKKIDPLFPRIDIKISQLEKETSPHEEQKSTQVGQIANPTMKSKSGWRDWGDHPLVVIIGSVAALIAIIVFITGKSDLAGFFAPAETPSPTAQVTSTFELSTSTLEPPTETSIAMLVPTPTLGIGSFMISDKDGMKLLYVPAGNFLMGSADSDPDAQADEKPQHTVYLDAFWIDQTDVTNAMYAKCVSAGACQSPTYQSSSTRPSYYGNSQFDNYPMMNVYWNMADTYCKWAGRQLPTEAQWEKAARGTDGRIYPWGNDAPNNTLLNYNSGVGGDITAVGSYPKGASVYGALDMAGNVLQWVADWYSNTYYQSSPSSNPLGPDSGLYRVQRGGSWFNYGIHVRAANRDFSAPSNSSVDNFFSFRCFRGTQ